MIDKTCDNCDYIIVCEYGIVCLLRKGLLKDIKCLVCDDWNDDVSESELTKLRMEFSELKRKEFEKRCDVK